MATEIAKMGSRATPVETTPREDANPQLTPNAIELQCVADLPAGSAFTVLQVSFEPYLMQATSRFVICSMGGWVRNDTTQDPWNLTIQGQMSTAVDDPPVIYGQVVEPIKLTMPAAGSANAIIPVSSGLFHPPVVPREGERYNLRIRAGSGGAGSGSTHIEVVLLAVVHYGSNLEDL